MFGNREFEDNFNRKLDIDSASVLDIGKNKIRGEVQARFTSRGLDASNRIVIRGKLLDEEDNEWTDLAVLEGNQSKVVNISTYDQIQVECTVYGGTPGKILMSAFFFKLSDVDAISAGAGTRLLNVPCAPSVFVGAAVITDGVTVSNALADDISTSNVLGIVVEKNGTLCDVQVSGLTESIFTGLDVTKEYFLSSSVAGEITATPPTGSGHVVVKLGQPFNGTTFLVDKATKIVRA